MEAQRKTRKIVTDFRGLNQQSEINNQQFLLASVSP
jgi:hypothetical protein